MDGKEEILNYILELANIFRQKLISNQEIKGRLDSLVQKIENTIASQNSGDCE